jgi:FkbM family methyltransferase
VAQPQVGEGGGAGAALIEMVQGEVAEELEELLSESPAAAAARLRAEALAHTEGGPLYALYGAGQLGCAVLARLRAVGVEPVAFADDTPAKQGRVVEGLPVMRPLEARQKFGPQLVFVVTILNPLLNFVTARQRLQELTGARVLSFLHLAWRYPDTFLPYYQFEEPQKVLQKSADIRRAFQLFADEESRRQFVGHLRFRLHLDHRALPPCKPDNYFPPDVLPEPLPPDTVFIDCGAFDGDTVRAFLSQQQGRFGCVFAFEPDRSNCELLRAYVNSLDADTTSRIHVFQAGVGRRREKLRFEQAGNMSSSFSAAGEVEVDVMTIDEVAYPGSAPVYVKFDVEGAEWQALQGCERLLEHGNPILAISIYHRPDDLWQLPLYVASKKPDYRFFLRTQGEDGMDVIGYCVPRND